MATFEGVVNPKWGEWLAWVANQTPAILYAVSPQPSSWAITPATYSEAGGALQPLDWDNLVRGALPAK